MGAMKQHPRYNVVSMRVSDEEKELLHQIVRVTRKSISDIMREALHHMKPKMDFTVTANLTGSFSDIQSRK